MFAVLKTGGKQYRVQAGDVLRVERLAAEAGEKVQFNEILMVGGDSPVVGLPLVDGAAVQAEVIDQIKADKVIHFVKRRRKHSSQRTKGHRPSRKPPPSPWLKRLRTRNRNAPRARSPRLKRRSNTPWHIKKQAVHPVTVEIRPGVALA